MEAVRCVRSTLGTQRLFVACGVCVFLSLSPRAWIPTAMAAQKTQRARGAARSMSSASAGAKRSTFIFTLSASDQSAAAGSHRPRWATRIAMWAGSIATQSLKRRRT